MSRRSERRILIISHDVVGSQMAGPGIRYWEIARVFASRQPATLLAPQPIDLAAPGLECAAYQPGDAASLAPWLAAADLVVANGWVLASHPELAGLDQPLALDLYDPTLLENLELFRGREAGERDSVNQRDTLLLNRQLAAGDFFLCATERQRDLYIGALMGAGRLTPGQTDADPQLRGLIDVVPFGLPANPPAKAGPALRGAIAGIGQDDRLILWTGGLWDWLDPLTLIEALPRVLERHPNARLAFLAGQHPNNAHRMEMPGRARALAAERGLLGRQVFFYDQWVPYERRADFLLEADIAVSLHRNHLETAFAAVRSRFLDHLWAGLLRVGSAGDAAAELVARHQLGRVAAAEDAGEVAAALIGLLDEPAELAACAERARQLGATLSWPRVLGPLLAWADTATKREAPSMDEATPAGPAEGQADHQPPDAPAAPAGTRWGPHPARASDLDRLLAQVRKGEGAWKLPAPQPIAPGRLPDPRIAMQNAIAGAVGPALEQQSDFNAALIHALYWLLDETQAAEKHQQAAQEYFLARGTELEARSEARWGELGGRAGAAEARIDDLDQRMRAALPDDQLRQLLLAFQRRISDLEAGMSALARQLGEAE